MAEKFKITYDGHNQFRGFEKGDPVDINQVGRNMQHLENHPVPEIYDADEEQQRLDRYRQEHQNNMAPENQPNNLNLETSSSANAGELSQEDIDGLAAGAENNQVPQFTGPGDNFNVQVAPRESGFTLQQNINNNANTGFNLSGGSKFVEVGGGAPSGQQGQGYYQQPGNPQYAPNQQFQQPQATPETVPQQQQGNPELDNALRENNQLRDQMDRERQDLRSQIEELRRRIEESSQANSAENTQPAIVEGEDNQAAEDPRLDNQEETTETLEDESTFEVPEVTAEERERIQNELNQWRDTYLLARRQKGNIFRWVTHKFGGGKIQLPEGIQMPDGTTLNEVHLGGKDGALILEKVRKQYQKKFKAVRDLKTIDKNQELQALGLEQSDYILQLNSGLADIWDQESNEIDNAVVKLFKKSGKWQKLQSMYREHKFTRMALGGAMFLGTMFGGASAGIWAAGRGGMRVLGSFLTTESLLETASLSPWSQKGLIDNVKSVDEITQLIESNPDSILDEASRLQMLQIDKGVKFELAGRKRKGQVELVKAVLEARNKILANRSLEGRANLTPEQMHEQGIDAMSDLMDRELNSFNKMSETLGEDERKMKIARKITAAAAAGSVGLLMGGNTMHLFGLGAEDSIDGGSDFITTVENPDEVITANDISGPSIPEEPTKVRFVEGDALPGDASLGEQIPTEFDTSVPELTYDPNNAPDLSKFEPVKLEAIDSVGSTPEIPSVEVGTGGFSEAALKIQDSGVDGLQGLDESDVFDMLKTAEGVDGNPVNLMELDYVADKGVELQFIPAADGVEAHFKLVNPNEVQLGSAEDLYKASGLSYDQFVEGDNGTQYWENRVPKPDVSDIAVNGDGDFVSQTAEAGGSSIGPDGTLQGTAEISSVNAHDFGDPDFKNLPESQLQTQYSLKGVDEETITSFRQAFSEDGILSSDQTKDIRKWLKVQGDAYPYHPRIKGGSFEEARDAFRTILLSNQSPEGLSFALDNLVQTDPEALETIAATLDYNLLAKPDDFTQYGLDFNKVKDFSSIIHDKLDSALDPDAVRQSLAEAASGDGDTVVLDSDVSIESPVLGNEIPEPVIGDGSPQIDTTPVDTVPSVDGIPSLESIPSVDALTNKEALDSFLETAASNYESDPMIYQDAENYYVYAEDASRDMQMSINKAVLDAKGSINNLLGDEVLNMQGSQILRQSAEQSGNAFNSRVLIKIPKAGIFAEA